jgi:hypothetical protein
LRCAAKLNRLQRRNGGGHADRPGNSSVKTPLLGDDGERPALQSLGDPGQ